MIFQRLHIEYHYCGEGERKRNYEKFTMPTTDCDEIMIICHCLVSFSIATICAYSKL